ncbi:related to Casein kinase II subunit alpha' [Nakaseomyces glabratus]|nr:related to Casein kinase II subunit alpha' [Nakaseomyces glabratus]SLM11030.1 related to Casein kinase II subunit alpha' [Nakaseomyces glabratus]
MPLPPSSLNQKSSRVYSVARVYKDACEQRPQEYWDYEQGVTIDWGKISNYEIVTKIGRAVCYQGVEAGEDEEDLQGVEDPDQSDRWAQSANSTGLLPLHGYNAQGREATECHDRPCTEEVEVNRLGSGRVLPPRRGLQRQSGLPLPQGPELLVNLNQYDYSLDLWSVGCMLAAIIFKKEPFFKGSSNADQLVKIADVLGTKELMAYLAKYGLKLPSEYDHIMRDFTRKPWEHFVTSSTPLAVPVLVDLVDHLLRYDHQERLTAREAMDHEFFKTNFD